MTRPLIAAAFLITLFAAGQAAAQTIRPDTDENLEYAASVVQLNVVPSQRNLGVKLFGMAGGDPAMNGLQTYLGFYESPAEGWTVFRIGDFLNYRILSATPGRVNLQVQENFMNNRDQIRMRSRRLTLRWTPGRDDTPPATVTMTRAR
jgi:hypothetical protein